MLDDLLGARSHDRRKYGHSEHWASGGEYHGGRHSKHFHIGMVLGALRAIAQNRILLAGFVLSGLVLLALGAWVLVTLLTLSGPIFDFASQNGVKGVVDTALILAQKLWEGTGK